MGLELSEEEGAPPAPNAPTHMARHEHQLIRVLVLIVSMAQAALKIAAEEERYRQELAKEAALDRVSVAQFRFARKIAAEEKLRRKYLTKEETLERPPNGGRYRRKLWLAHRKKRLTKSYWYYR